MKTAPATPLNVDAYIQQYPEATQKAMQVVRAAIKAAAPGVEELISYKMPAYKLNGVLVYFAAYNNHVGFYATPTGHNKFKKELSIYKTGKGSVQFPLDQPMPIELIKKIVQFRVKENLDKQKKKNKK